MAASPRSGRSSGRRSRPSSADRLRDLAAGSTGSAGFLDDDAVFAGTRAPAPSSDLPGAGRRREMPSGGFDGAAPTGWVPTWGDDPPGRRLIEPRPPGRRRGRRFGSPVSRTGADPHDHLQGVPGPGVAREGGQADGADWDSADWDGADWDGADWDGADWDDADGEDAESDLEERPARFRAVRHRTDRWTERWVPEPLRRSRSRLSGRSAVLLTVVGVVAVLVAGWTWWSGRSVESPVGSAVPVLQAEPSSLSSAAGEPPPAPTAPATEPMAATEIWVSVTGRVLTPGLYPLPSGARVAEALEAAGGLLDPADLTGINLAQPLTDGQSVVVAAAGTELRSATVAPPAAPATEPSSGVVDLNSADQAALESLPGVGPVMAQAILTWRTDNGPFTSVEQLQEVTGIGPARYAQLAPLVSV